MYETDIDIDFSDIPEITDFSKGFKKPELARNLKKYGYTIRIHHGPPDGGWYEIKKVTPEEIAARDAMRKEYYSIYIRR